MASNIKLRQNSLLLRALLLTSDPTTDEKTLSEILDRDEGEWIRQIGVRAYSTGLGCIEITPESTHVWEYIAEKLGSERKHLPNLQDHLQYILKSFDSMSNPTQQTRYGPQGRKFEKMSWKQIVSFLCSTFGLGISLPIVQNSFWTDYDPAVLCKHLNRSPLFKEEEVDVEWTKAAVNTLKGFFEKL